jgi:F-box protein 18 (helicase)
MTSKLTEEQQAVVAYIQKANKSNKTKLVLIDSVAGSGKTTLLKEIAENTKSNKSLYLAYNKAIATSSKDKFPSHVHCCTTHSLAYRAVVIPQKLKVGFFGYKDITEKIPYRDKAYLIEDIREFCLSAFLSYDDYAKVNGRINAPLANRYLNLMAQGLIDCTHDFYLKNFHLSLHSGDISYPEYDLLMLDEAGDLNEVTLEIFKLLPSKIKVAVGDPYQNIYTFNHTINCFDKLKGQGTTFKLSKSFRVPKKIAKPVESFCKKYLNPEMKFKGISSTTTEIVTRGYISRTNTGLINKLIELNEDKTPYGLVRKAKEIFKVPLMVAGLKYQGKIYDPAYKQLQDDVDDWYENTNQVKVKYKTLMAYLMSEYSEDIALKQAFNLVSKHGKSGIFEAYAEATKHENKKQDFMLLTAHSGKGLEFDEVILAPDMNSSIEELLIQIALDPKKVLEPSERESLNLYYVAATRAIVTLKNAIHLPR